MFSRVQKDFRRPTTKAAASLWSARSGSGRFPSPGMRAFQPRQMADELLPQSLPEDLACACRIARPADHQFPDRPAPSREHVPAFSSTGKLDGSTRPRRPERFTSGFSTASLHQEADGLARGPVPPSTEPHVWSGGIGCLISSACSLDRLCTLGTSRRVNQVSPAGFVLPALAPAEVSCAANWMASTSASNVRPGSNSAKAARMVVGTPQQLVKRHRAVMPVPNRDPFYVRYRRARSAA